MILNSDAAHIPLANESVHTIITSPPYWRMRDYGVAGQIGLEEEADCQGWITGEYCGECYVCHILQVFAELYRVLRSDGTVWFVIGDCYSYAGGEDSKYHKNGYIDNSRQKYNNILYPHRKSKQINPKNLMGIPWRIAMALQNNQWYLRSNIIWSKVTPSPESVLDRPYNAYEYILLFSKSRSYYFDMWGLKELSQLRGVRYYRNVWTLVGEPQKHNHIAPYPKKLVEPCIIAGTSEMGCCPICGKQWHRIIQNKEFVGWQPSCDHQEHPTPSTILDPFSGSGTTGLVAIANRRNYIGLELKFDYAQYSKERMKDITVKLI